LKMGNPVDQTTEKKRSY